MTPNQFLADVCWPNIVGALENPQSVRSCANAILTLDALMGCMFWHLRDKGDPAVAKYGDKDSQYKDSLADENKAIGELRDAAFALKHGRLTLKPDKRVMTDASQMAVGNNSTGFFQMGDSLAGSLVFLDLKTGLVDARSVIAKAGNYLKDLVAAVDL